MRLAFCTLAAAVALGAFNEPPQQVFKTRVDGVRIDVAVFNGNKPIGGLTAADFEVLDNGVPQTIDNMTVEDVPFSMLLVLDTSDSMLGSPLKALKAAATAAINALGPDDRAAVMSFSEVLRQTSAWKKKGQDLMQAIDGLRASGTTALFDAAFTSLAMRDPDPARRALVLLFSDGEDTSSWLPAAAAVDKASRTDAVIYAVVLSSSDHRATQAREGRRLALRSGVTLTPGAPIIEQSAFLPDLAERTGGEALTAETTGKLRDAFERIVTDFRSRYLLSYMPKGVDESGWHRLDVKVKGRRLTIKARRGYQR